ncbi:DNA-directed RNA polymerase subunit B'' [Candidatus Undinarchaeota archaeon]
MKKEINPIIQSFFKSNSLVKHHLNSYNGFLETGLQSVIDEIGQINPELEDFHIKLGKINVGDPVAKEADGSTRKVYPNEARLRDRTYSAPMTLEMTPVENGEEQETLKVVIGKLPIMLHSKKCLLNGLTDDELIRVGEDTQDPGGYFIVNGTERVLVLVEDLASNRILVEHHNTTNTNVAKIFSARGWYRRPCTLEIKSDSSLMFVFPPLAKPISVFIIMKALGLKTDKDIVEAVSKNPAVGTELFVALEEAAEVQTTADALDYIGKRVAVGQQREQRIERAQQVLDRYLLPHVGMEPTDRLAKAFFVGKMVDKLIKYNLGKIPADDKDHYANKRLRLAGELMEDVFRVAFRGLVANAVYSLEKAARRDRKVSIRIAIRSTLLTDRIGHAMATGSWVGGRQGISQHLDRLNYMSTISHLRRVRSLLSRTQPHFEARDLHATHWGKICPNETPEGSNIGLVKNLALLADISNSVDDKIVEDALSDLGVVRNW